MNYYVGLHAIILTLFVFQRFIKCSLESVYVITFTLSINLEVKSEVRNRRNNICAPKTQGARGVLKFLLGFKGHVRGTSPTYIIKIGQVQEAENVGQKILHM